MKKQKHSKKKTIFMLVIVCSLIFFSVSETSKILEEMYFSRFKEGYKEGFIAGAESGFIDGYAANRRRKRGGE